MNSFRKHQWGNKPLKHTNVCAMDTYWWETFWDIQKLIYNTVEGTYRCSTEYVYVLPELVISVCCYENSADLEHLKQYKR